MTDKLRNWMFMALMVLCIGGLLTACDKKDDEENQSENSNKQQNNNASMEMSDMENFIEMSLKMEKMRLLFTRFCSNNYEGDLLAGAGDKSDPTEMYKLLEEMLDNKEKYLKAVKRLDQQGLFDHATTRGVWSVGWDMIYYGWGVTAHNREQDILDVLNNSKIMGNEEQMRDLFNKSSYKKGETDYKKWFTNLINHKYTNACPRIYQEWFHDGGNVSKYSDGPGVQTFYDYVDKHHEGNGNPIHQDAYRVGVEQALKAANFNVAVWDAATGGVVGKWQDVNTIIEETKRLREKIRKGTATAKDYRRFVAGLGGVWTKQKLGEFIGEDLGVENGVVDAMVGETEDWLIDKAMEENTDDATAKANNEAIVKAKNTETEEANKPAVVIVYKEDGGLTVAPTDKNGNATIPMKPEKATVTTVTKGGKTAKQPADVKPGVQEMELELTPQADKYDWDIEFDPEELVVEAEGDQRVVTVITMYKNIKASTGADWIDVEVNGYNVHLDIKENTTAKERKGTIYIYASDDGKNVLKTATYEVTQLPYDDKNDGLGFMNFSKLRIEKITGSGLTGTMNYIWKGNTQFDNDELTITRVSETVYKVSARRADNQHIYMNEEEPEPNPNCYVYPDRPYGDYYDLKFTIEAASPSIMFDKNNFRLTDLSVKGYCKYIDATGRDDYLEFNCYYSGLGIQDPMGYEDSNYKQAIMDTDNQDGEFYDYDKGERVGGKYPFYVKYTATSKWVSPIYGKDEQGHSVIINYEPEEAKTDKETTETYDINLMIKLRWD